ncbi:HPr family phosphocarrier protein [Cellulomonas hominis]|jgi:phosphotransferase system HPr (HPr) family protein|uniref:Phosphocarrier protein HPr n=1 Tax=Cellulomonas hominis TaxID=156981 RepID=A0A511FDJ8_9CELL|nr:HPr family phosphocarrier protein [Cellulomonas hominis]MBB5472017.1 phosphotransferase system HPr (HPr) family protein [Cellulomonas hominis]MBU5423365.1 HPr family phosphocarrier protein [Cellulomonas hominis]NKY12507.1 HPr family phosphocarrier protein [Cellulomonas hominis]GEL47283.1 phosphocarrier protein [Cellulomonas hominis]
MPHRRARVATATGLHARPASLLTRAAADGGHAVLIGRDGEPAVDAASILSVMGLKLQHGEEVVLSADAADAEPLLEELAALLATDLDLVGQS